MANGPDFQTRLQRVLVCHLLDDPSSVDRLPPGLDAADFPDDAARVGFEAARQAHRGGGHPTTRPDRAWEILAASPQVFGAAELLREAVAANPTLSPAPEAHGRLVLQARVRSDLEKAGFIVAVVTDDADLATVESHLGNDANRLAGRPVDGDAATTGRAFDSLATRSRSVAALPGVPGLSQHGSVEAERTVLAACIRQPGLAQWVDTDWFAVPKHRNSFPFIAARASDRPLTVIAELAEDLDQQAQSAKVFEQVTADFNPGYTPQPPRSPKLTGVEILDLAAIRVEPEAFQKALAVMEKQFNARVDDAALREPGVRARFDAAMTLRTSATTHRDGLGGALSAAVQQVRMLRQTSATSAPSSQR